MPHKDPTKRKEYQRKYQQEWRKANPSQWKDITHKADKKRGKTEKRKQELKEIKRRSHIRAKLRSFELLGGAMCKFCGNEKFEVLQVDHVNGGGAAHRKEIVNKYGNIYNYLSRNPEEAKSGKYRALCADCHNAWTNYGVAPGHNEYRSLDWWKNWSTKRTNR